MIRAAADHAHIRLPARAAYVVLPGKMKVKYLIASAKYISENYKKKESPYHMELMEFQHNFFKKNGIETGSKLSVS